jgi:Domain of unknown function (DUF1996)
MSMRRSLVFSLLALTAVSPLVGVAAAASDSDERDSVRLRGGLRYFAIGCAFSHRNQDDPIVFPGQHGRSHDHTYFGNRSTKAASTADSLRASGTTSCRLRADTAAYWAPTLIGRNGPVLPERAVVFYVRRTVEPVQAFPAGLQMIGGSAAARTAQSRAITFWSCGPRGGGQRFSSIPTCAGGGFGGRGSDLHLHVNYPNCWDGERLDSRDHQSHMAYSSDGVCPGSHPVEVPALSLVIDYGIAGGSGLELSSGGQFSGHADFVNAWNQRVLTALVDRYLNRTGRRR